MCRRALTSVFTIMMGDVDTDLVSVATRCHIWSLCCTVPFCLILCAVLKV